MGNDSEWTVAKNFKSDAGIFLKRIRKVTKNLRQNNRYPTDISIGYLPNISLDDYHYINLIGNKQQFSHFGGSVNRTVILVEDKAVS
jgi:hypothetical protein